MQELRRQQAQQFKAPSKKKGSAKKRREQEKREQLYELANDDEIQARAAQGASRYRGLSPPATRIDA